jgi:2-octaprenylphenol hydroxylase
VGLATSEKGHADTAFQAFADNHIIGVLPMNDDHTHSIIYSCIDSEKEALLSADKTMQDCMLTNGLKGALGMMQWTAPIKAIPLVRQAVVETIKPHIALIGDAAHRIHPLAGQGANLGIADALCLADTLKQACAQNRPIGSMRALKPYHIERTAENKRMLCIHDVLKESFADNTALVTQLRHFSLRAINSASLLKAALIQFVR